MHQCKEESKNYTKNTTNKNGPIFLDFLDLLGALKQEPIRLHEGLFDSVPVAQW